MIDLTNINLREVSTKENYAELCARCEKLMAIVIYNTDTSIREYWKEDYCLIIDRDLNAGEHFLEDKNLYNA